MLQDGSSSSSGSMAAMDDDGAQAEEGLPFGRHATAGASLHSICGN